METEIGKNLRLQSQVSQLRDDIDDFKKKVREFTKYVEGGILELTKRRQQERSNL